MTYDPSTDCQQAVLEVAIDLLRIKKRLGDIAAVLPIPWDLEQMQTDVFPHVVGPHLYGILGAVRELMGDAISTLIRAANTNDVDLRAEWENMLEG